MRSAAGWKPAGPCLARLWGGTTGLRHFVILTADERDQRARMVLKTNRAPDPGMGCKSSVCRHGQCTGPACRRGFENR